VRGKGHEHWTVDRAPGGGWGEGGGGVADVSNEINPSEMLLLQVISQMIHYVGWPSDPV
jgi:hypothetical protein